MDVVAFSYTTQYFTYTAIPQDDGVAVYIEWSDGQQGDIMSFDTIEEAKKHYYVLLTP